MGDGESSADRRDVIKNFIDSFEWTIKNEWRRRQIEEREESMSARTVISLEASSYLSLHWKEIRAGASVHSTEWYITPAKQVFPVEAHVSRMSMSVMNER